MKQMLPYIALIYTLSPQQQQYNIVCYILYTRNCVFGKCNATRRVHREREFWSSSSSSCMRALKATRGGRAGRAREDCFTIYTPDENCYVSCAHFISLARLHPRRDAKPLCIYIYIYIYQIAPRNSHSIYMARPDPF